MKFYFDAETCGFFSDAIHGPREIPGPLEDRARKAGKRAPMLPNPECSIPASAVEIDPAEMRRVMKAQEEGQEIVARGGKPGIVARSLDPSALRARRDRLLAESDWTQLPDSPLDPAERGAWAVYRQALRDLDMASDELPTPPGEVSDI